MATTSNKNYVEYWYSFNGDSPLGGSERFLIIQDIKF